MHGQLFRFCSVQMVIPGLSFMATRRVADLYYRCFEEIPLQITMEVDDSFQHAFSFALVVAYGFQDSGFAYGQRQLMD